MKNLNVLRFIAMALMAAVIFTGCGDNEKQIEDPDPTFSINPNTTTIHFTAQDVVPMSYVVETNQPDWDYTVTPASDWLTVTKTADGFNVTAEENLNPESRVEAVIKLTAGEAAPVEIKVNQDGLDPVFTITEPEEVPETLAFTAGGTESYSFAVRTNQPEWDVTASEDWVVIEKDAENNTFTITAALNGEMTSREATITLASGFADDITLNVAQKEMQIFTLGYDSRSTSYLETSIVYWKNGVKTVFNGDGNFYPAKMFVYNDEVHAVGSWRGAGASQALYFKPDGSYVDMTNTIGSTVNSNANGIWVDEDGVCISYYQGPKYWYDGDLSTTTMAMLWKDGDVTELSEHLGYATSSGIWKDGDDVYVLGEFDGMRGYWKNGTYMDYADAAFYVSSSGSKFGGLTALKVIDGVVYLGGYTYEWDSGAYEGFWYAGQQKHIANLDYVYALDVDDSGNVWTAGNSGIGWLRKATVSKNGEVIYLISEDNMNAVSCAMKIWGNDVYIVTSSFGAPSQSSTTIGRLYKVDADNNVTLIEEYSATEGTSGVWMMDIWIQ